ncbi:hypothetical protein [Geobacter sp.]|uniref:hypothetical protein n=1 Tax=Geobacter sp. TaxID=46610 RepID=UPI0027BA545D|nr:hypothetical protein [Geobacter sp.]
MGNIANKLIVTLTGGGFLWEAKALINGLGEGYEYHYVTTPDALVTSGDGMPHGEVHLISRVTSMSDNSLAKRMKNLVISIRDSYRVIKTVKPDAVICIGSSIAVPLCFWAKVFGKKAVFVESITRVTNPSFTGKILSTLGLCDRFYVQWPEAEKLYRGAVYRGSVL